MYANLKICNLQFLHRWQRVTWTKSAEHQSSDSTVQLATLNYLAKDFEKLSKTAIYYFQVVVVFNV